MFGISSKNKVVTDDAQIDLFLTRGVENVYPNKDFLKNLLKKGNQLTIYLGIDPTGPTLHLGHAIVLKKLRDFQKIGHKVILLIGDFTGMIGDPTDKTATRKKLTREEVLNNAKLYKKQAETFLSFSGSNSAELKYNSKWLAKMNFGDVLELASRMTVQQMLERDMFKKREQEMKPIHIHEFMYPLMQGYDSVAMNVDGEIGGNDQTFNMLAGRDLMKQILNKEKFVITTKLLEDSTGKKMGKTEGNMITLADNSKDMFGKVMSWTDGMIIPGFELCTDVSVSEIEKIKKELEAGANPKNIKVRLAKEIVSLYHSKSEAEKAEKNFNEVFRGGAMPEEVEIVEVKKGESLIDVLISKKIVVSRGEFKRLVDDDAIGEVGGEKIKNYDAKVLSDMNLKVGKKRFIKIIAK